MVAPRRIPRRIARPAFATLAVVALLALAGCETNPLVVRRSACPAAAVPTFAGDVTLFGGDGTADAANIDVVATVTNLRATCAEGAMLASDVSWQVVARRSDAGPARQVTLPLFVSLVQGGNLLVSKQLMRVTLDFPAGQARAATTATARADVARSAATLPDAILDKVNRKRRPGDLDAATDPMSDPEVRAAVRAASFEVLVGFQLDERQLAFNIAK